MIAAVEYYPYRDQENNCILLWDHARFVNHSFHPHTCSFTALPEPGCDRSMVSNADLPMIVAQLDPLIEAAVRRSGSVGQPLKPLIDWVTLERLERMAQRHEPMPSLLGRPCA